VLNAFISREAQVGTVPMPGYTHLQRAMLSSVGMWLGAYAEGTVDLLREGKHLLEALDTNPLGAGAGFGVTLPLDRALTAKLLGFSRVQRNPIDVQNSRGRYELRTLRWLCENAALVEKLAWDLLLFSSDEFGFFALPGELLTGSSIMPQKHNPDVLELLRASSGKIRGAEAELANVIGKLPSSYHRDFQFSKEPLVRAVNHVQEMLEVTRVVVESFKVNEPKLQAALSPEIYATYEAYRQVKKGVAFRDAYRDAAKQCTAGTLDVAGLKSDFGTIAQAVSASFAELREESAALSREFEEIRCKLERLEQAAFELPGK
jgi:argininosuccinate lyase